MFGSGRLNRMFFTKWIHIVMLLDIALYAFSVIVTSWLVIDYSVWHASLIGVVMLFYTVLLVWISVCTDVEAGRPRGLSCDPFEWE